MHQKYPLPSYLSVLFFPLGFFLGYWWGTVSLSKLIVGPLILSLTVYYIFTNYSIDGYYFSILLTINFISSLYLLGLHIGYKRENDQHFGGMNPTIVRWVSVPIMTLLIYLAVIVICATSNSDLVLDFYETADFLYENTTLSILLISWIVFLFWSYATIKETAS